RLDKTGIWEESRTTRPDDLVAPQDFMHRAVGQSNVPTGDEAFSDWRLAFSTTARKRAWCGYPAEDQTLEQITNHFFMIITKTPLRVSFFGGGPDYAIWHRQYGSAVIATTINKCCY